LTYRLAPTPFSFNNNLRIPTMDYRDHTSLEFVERECKLICDHVKQMLRKVIEGKSYTEEGLFRELRDIAQNHPLSRISTNEEIYEDFIWALIHKEVEKLDPQLKQTIWFQIDSAVRWHLGVNKSVQTPINDDEIIGYIFSFYIKYYGLDGSHTDL
jgi:hypothetical protein